jgi:hypothetical protein
VKQASLPFIALFVAVVAACGQVNVDAVGPPPGAACEGAACVPDCSGETCTCAADRALCGGYCALLTTDARNCGECGLSCGEGLFCAGGTCRCAGGTLDCDGECIDVRFDPQNCGECGRSCEAERECRDGACLPISG